MEKLFKATEKYILFIVIFLFPFFVLSTASNPYTIPKLQLLFYGISVLLLVRVVRIITTGKFEFATSGFDLPIVVMIIAYILSTVLKTPNKMEAIMLPGTATALVVSAFLFFFVNQLSEKDRDKLKVVLSASAVLNSLLIILSFSTLLSKLSFLPAFLKSRGFTPDGGYLYSLILLAGVLPLLAALIITQKKLILKISYLAGASLVVIAILVSIYNIIPGRDFAPKLPALQTSWSIAIDSLKESPFLGIGPGNYLSAFSRYRPLSYNYSDIWGIKFASARNYYFTVFTETGILGFSTLLLLLYSVFKSARKDLKEQKLVNWGFAGLAPLISLVIFAVLLGIFPATAALTAMFFVLLSLNSKVKSTHLNLTAQSTVENDTVAKATSRFPALLLALPILVVVGYGLFKSVNIVKAEYKYKKSLDALLANDALKTYDTIREAIRLNPRVDRYRSTFARINLVLANGIVAKKELSDDDRKTILQLVQQAISEGKATVALNPLRSGSWEALAGVYRSVIPLAKDADAFAIQAYRQAIVLDPVDPNLRIALGGVYFARKDYDNAINVFAAITSQVKTDLPNAHFNLAYALKEKGRLDEAIKEMTVVMSLVDRNTQDYEVARKALEDMQNKKKELAESGSENLTPPQEGEQVLKPPVELPEGSEPPEAVVTPTPSATLTPTPSVTVTPTPSPTSTATPTVTP